MKRSLFLLLSIICILSAGCTGPVRAAKPSKCRVVTEITVEVKNAPKPGLRRYSDPKKMTKALNYLRHLDPWDAPAADPEASDAPVYRITLQLSDGSEKIYEQIGLSYFKEPGSPWKEIPPEDGIRLPLLLAAVQSDTIL